MRIFIFSSKIWAKKVCIIHSKYGNNANFPKLPKKIPLSFVKNFYCYSITVVCIFSPSLHPTSAKPTSLPLDFVHVSFIVAPVNPSPHYPLPTPLWLLLDYS